LWTHTYIITYHIIWENASYTKVRELNLIERPLFNVTWLLKNSCDFVYVIHVNETFHLTVKFKKILFNWKLLKDIIIDHNHIDIIWFLLIYVQCVQVLSETSILSGYWGSLGILKCLHDKVMGCLKGFGNVLECWIPPSACWMWLEGSNLFYFSRSECPSPIPRDDGSYPAFSGDRLGSLCFRMSFGKLASLLIFLPCWFIVMSLR